jgi:hypothetical protein
MNLRLIEFHMNYSDFETWGEFMLKKSSASLADKIWYFDRKTAQHMYFSRPA